MYIMGRLAVGRYRPSNILELPRTEALAPLLVVGVYVQDALLKSMSVCAIRLVKDQDLSKIANTNMLNSRAPNSLRALRVLFTIASSGLVSKSKSGVYREKYGKQFMRLVADG